MVEYLNLYGMKIALSGDTKAARKLVGTANKTMFLTKLQNVHDLDIISGHMKFDDGSKINVLSQHGLDSARIYVPPTTPGGDDDVIEEIIETVDISSRFLPAFFAFGKNPDFEVFQWIGFVVCQKGDFSGGYRFISNEETKFAVKRQDLMSIEKYIHLPEMEARLKNTFDSFIEAGIEEVFEFDEEKAFSTINIENTVESFVWYPDPNHDSGTALLIREPNVTISLSSGQFELILGPEFQKIYEFALETEQPIGYDEISDSFYVDPFVNIYYLIQLLNGSYASVYVLSATNTVAAPESGGFGFFINAYGEVIFDINNCKHNTGVAKGFDIGTDEDGFYSGAEVALDVSLYPIKEDPKYNISLFGAQGWAAGNENITEPVPASEAVSNAAYAIAIERDGNIDFIITKFSSIPMESDGTHFEIPGTDLTHSEDDLPVFIQHSTALIKQYTKQKKKYLRTTTKRNGVIIDVHEKEII